MKKEIPILFSTLMVQALLAGRKTMTRRIIKPQPDKRATHFNYSATTWPKTPWVARVELKCGPGYEVTNGYKCPYGKAGDILWVKENFIVVDFYNDIKALEVQYEDATRRICKLTDKEWSKFTKWQRCRGKFSKLFCFKSISRIWLQVESVRVELLQDISEEDAKAEGVEPLGSGYKSYDVPGCGFYGKNNAAQCSFKTLWQSLHGKESWNENPWLWVVSFKILSTSGRPAALDSDSIHIDAPMIGVPEVLR